MNFLSLPGILKVFDTFKYVFKYIVSITISVSWSHVMSAKLITFTANHLSPNNFHWLQLYCVFHPTVLIIEESTWQQVSNVCLLRAIWWISTWQWLYTSISPFFFSQAPSWHQAILFYRLPFKKRNFCHNFDVVCRVRIRQNSTHCDTLEL